MSDPLPAPETVFKNLQDALNVALRTAANGGDPGPWLVASESYFALAAYLIRAAAREAELTRLRIDLETSNRLALYLMQMAQMESLTIGDQAWGSADDGAIIVTKHHDGSRTVTIEG